MSDTNANEHARTDARTAEYSAEKISLIRALDEGDKVLFRAGNGKGSTAPVKPLTVTESCYRSALIQPHDDDGRVPYVARTKTLIGDGHPDFENGESYGTGDYTTHREIPYDDKCNLLVEVEYDEWVVTVEGPQGGEYQLVEDDGDVYHRNVSHDGIGGRLLWVSLESRDGDEAAAQDAFDNALGEGDEATTRHGDRPIVFQNRDHLGPLMDDLKYKVEINDDDEFVVTPTTETADLHVYDEMTVSHRGGRSHHYVFEDNYEMFVEEGVKDDVFKKGGSLDWNRAHQQCHKNRDWEWSVDRSALAYVLEHLAERGHTVTVAADYAKRSGNEDFARENPDAQVPGVDADGTPMDNAEFREDDTSDDKQDANGDADDTGTSAPADADAHSAAASGETDSVAEMGRRMCDGGTVEETMAQERRGFDLLTDEGGVAFTDILRMAADRDISAEAAVTNLREYGLFPVDARGEELTDDEFERLANV